MSAARREREAPGTRRINSPLLRREDDPVPAMGTDVLFYLGEQWWVTRQAWGLFPPPAPTRATSP